VAIGRALVRDVDVFLFDEPLSNLDAKLRADLRVEIKRLHQQLANTMIYVTHDQVEAMTLADRIAIMRGGQVLQLGTPSEIYNRPQNRYVADFIGSPAMNFLDGHWEGGAFRSGDILIPMAGYELAAPQVADRPATLGIRPEHVATGGLLGEAPVRVEAEVELVEPMGSDTLVWVTLAGTPFRIRMDGQAQVAPGDRLAIGLDPSKAPCSTARRKSGSKPTKGPFHDPGPPRPRGGVDALGRAPRVHLPHAGAGRRHHGALRGGADPGPLLGAERVRPAVDRGAGLDDHAAVHAGPTDVALVLDGLDTVAEVAVNGTAVLTSANQFRSHRVRAGLPSHAAEALDDETRQRVLERLSLRQAMRRGENEVTITFRSAPREAARLASAQPFPVPYIAQNNPIPHGNMLRKVACDWGWDWNIALAPFGVTGSVRIEPLDAPKLVSLKVRRNIRRPRACLGRRSCGAGPQ
jgi:hypothetical protein